MSKWELYDRKNNRNKKNEGNICLIRSFLITKLIFAYIPEKIKLNIIIYNKKIQRKLGIDFEYIKK